MKQNDNLVIKNRLLEYPERGEKNLFCLTSFVSILSVSSVVNLLTLPLKKEGVIYDLQIKEEIIKAA